MGKKAKDHKMALIPSRNPMPAAKRAGRCEYDDGKREGPLALFPMERDGWIKRYHMRQATASSPVSESKAGFEKLPCGNL